MHADPTTQAAKPDRERASSAPRGWLLALAVLDLAWAAVGTLATLVLLPLLLILAALQLRDDTVLRWIEEAWRGLAPLEQARVAATLVELLAAPVLNVFLLVGAVRLLRGRSGAERCLRIWAVGVLVLSAVDLAWITAAWVDPWSWIAVLLAVATPLWAVANLVALARLSSRARTAPAANGASA